MWPSWWIKNEGQVVVYQPQRHAGIVRLACGSMVPNPFARCFSSNRMKNTRQKVKTRAVRTAYQD